MALSLIIMFGQLGAIGGINLIGIVLFKYCTIVFHVFGVLQVGCCILMHFILKEIKFTGNN